MHVHGQTGRQTDRHTPAETGNLMKELDLSFPLRLKPYPSVFFFMAGTISVSMSTFRSNFRVKHSLLGS